MKKVGIIGASGYTGYELIKILMKHEGVSLEVLNSRNYAGKEVCSLYEDFKDKKLRFTNFSIEEINTMKLDLIFLAIPNGLAMQIVPKLNCRIVDLSGDYRFKDVEEYEKVYRIKHLDRERKAVYGLPEINREQIKKAGVVANPGCYVTACCLAALPLVRKKLIKTIIFDCKSGYSGAGKKKSYVNDPKHYTENIIAYKITAHRHKSEIEQVLDEKVSFTPHVIPVFQGIMATMHALLNKKIEPNEIKELYEEFYKKEVFIKIKDGLPELHDVQRTNYCCIGGFEVDDNNQVVVIATIDNLIKGASGQAVQNMNLMLGFKEDLGLEVT